MQTRAARLVRGTLAGGTSVLAAALSHQAAGGEAPSALAIGAGLVFGVLLGTALTARRPSWWRMLALVGVSQVAFHLVFVLLGTSAAIGTTMHGHHHLVAIDVLGVGDGRESAALGMWTAHAVAAVASALLLRHAEAGAWALLVTAGRLLARTLLPLGLVTPALPARPAAAAASPAPAGPRRLERATALRRRGPPLLAFS
ncbi:hypothetical protein [Homoserinibacter sp. YIM 151385]|uniref:hypothetical protein n=1 Tax=Homoserinibacter sp. YIM 151385 TaxID=2985506 RepID=UPI0022F07856|nr:hypothetical protein [Homoserinibacter sp. YIM 151385]WBU39017.1 hypothetical protein OF852_05400 [Homoserinibacter sp. YIM 151385]